MRNSSASHPFFLREASYSKAIASEIKTIKALSIHLILLFHPARSRLRLISPNASLALHCPRYPPSPYLPIRLSPTSLAHSLLPSLRLSIRSPRLPFVTLSDSLFPTICLCLPYFRVSQHGYSARIALVPYVISLS